MDEIIMKKCITCKKYLPLTSFNSHVHTSLYTREPATYYSSHCTQCNKHVCKKRRHTIQGVYSDIYNGQLNSSKTRQHTPPNYSKQELIKWLHLQPNFDELFNIWEKENYPRELKPSCDRLDNTQPYTLNNLRLVTWQENAGAYRKDVTSGKEVANCKAVNQFTLEGIFIHRYHSIAEACRATACSPGNLLKCCQGKKGYKTSKGFKWEYV